MPFDVGNQRCKVAPQGFSEDHTRPTADDASTFHFYEGLQFLKFSD